MSRTLYKVVCEKGPLSLRGLIIIREPRLSLYQQIAHLAGERDYDTYWERHFEHNATPESYVGSTMELGSALRELEEDAPRWRAENLVRAAFMRAAAKRAASSTKSPPAIV